MREAKLTCPQCGTKVTVYEDEIGEGTDCPGCGEEIEISESVFAEEEGAQDEPDRDDVAARLAKLVDDKGEGAAAGVPIEDDVPMDDLLEAEEAEQSTAEPEAANAEPAPVRTPAVSMAGSVEWPAEVLTPGFDFKLWETLAQDAGDPAMVARLGIWQKAAESGCEMMFTLPDGSKAPIPQMVLSEAAAAAGEGKDEYDWREEFTRALLDVARKWQDEPTMDGVVGIITYMDGVIADLRQAGMWPWPAES